MLSIRLRFPVQARLSTTARKEERWRRKKNEKEKKRIPDVNNPREKVKAHQYTFLCSRIDTSVDTPGCNPRLS